MKTKNILFVALIVLLAGMGSCKKDHDIPTGKVFNANDFDFDIVGTWGVEKIDYYDIDNAGNPIASTLQSHEYDPNDIDNGIQMVFREDNTGELYDKTSVDSTKVNPFAYTYVNDTLFLEIDYGTDTSTYSCIIVEKTNDSFIYENEYFLNHVEKAYLKRLSHEPIVLSDGFTVSVSANPANGGTVIGGGSYQGGQTCTVTATAQAGYTFVNWTENGNQVSTEASYTFTVTGNRTLVANFTLCDYTNIILNELNGETKFIEIYNKGTSDVPLNGMYIMKDDYVAGAIWTADVTIVAPAGGYVLLYSEDVVIDHPEHPENLIFHSGLSSKKSIRVTLFTPNGSVRDEFTRGTIGEWGQTISNVAPQSYARTPNGGDWKLANPTPGEANPSTGEDIPDVETPVNYTVTVSANPSNGGTVTGGGTYQQGQSCTVTAVPANGYTFIGWYEMISDEGGGSYVPVFSDANYSFTVNGDRTLRADFTYNGGSTTPEGAIDGKFTIDDNGNKVYFSHGNLQYNAVQGTHMCADGTTKPGTWQFAAHQYEIVGNTNSGIGEYYDGWIDLFGWGTSGYNNPSDPYNVNYYPWSTSWETVSEIYNYYGYGPSTNMLSPSLMDSSKNYDWGMYNVIYGAGNQPNQWRTLTSEEWVYVFKKRSTSTGIRYAKAQIIGLSGGESIIGMILLPDDWSTNYYTLNNTDQFQANFTSNIIEFDTWENSLESHGAVFLPASGYRSETSVSYVNHYGEYWSATYSDSSSAYYVHIGHSDFTPQSSNYKRYHGFSVRLVCSAQ